MSRTKEYLEYIHNLEQDQRSKERLEDYQRRNLKTNKTKKSCQKN